MSFYEFVKGKRVCFVGACPNIKGLEQGEMIDGFDIVIRTNGMISVLHKEELHKDYGKKIDILYTNNQFYREMSPFPIDEFKEKGVKWLCMKTCRDIESMNRNINARVIKRAMMDVNKYVTGALMGAYIFNDILMQDPKELFITGIDFFISKKKEFEHDNYKEYIPGYLPDKIREQGNQINVGKKEDGHSMIGNTKFIYHLWKESGKIRFPQLIHDLMLDIVSGRRVQE